MNTAIHQPSEFTELCARLKQNLDRGLPDQTDSVLRIATSDYLDPHRYQQEMRQIFFRVPLLVALGCDIPEPGDALTYELLEQPLLILRGDDGVARVFLNSCRHRGARVVCEPFSQQRSLVCPYHSWSYDRQGRLTGMPGADSFGDAGVDGLLELPSEERSGAVFACLRRDQPLQLDAWLAELGPSLDALRLQDLHPYRTTTTLDSANWKLTADGYLDGYHIGYLHKDTIGRKAITNRNTYDLLGPHVRVGFTNKALDRVDADAIGGADLNELMSLVHFVFPNVSIAGGLGDTLMLSRLLPGKTPDTSTTIQYQYFRDPLDNPKALAAAEEKRGVYERVVRDEDYITVFGINRALPALAGEEFVFGRNEVGSQHFHRTVASMLER